MNDEPLIYTTKGNVPVSSLEARPEWEIGDSRIVFKDRYFLNDELVKESQHVYLIKH